MKKQYKRIFLGIGILVMIITVIYYSLAPLTVAGIKVTPGQQKDKLTEEGTLYALHQWNLFPPQNLMVKEVLRQSGDQVEIGDLLLRLDDDLLQMQWRAEEKAIAVQLTALRGELAAVTQEKRQYSPEMIETALRGIHYQIEGLEAQLDFARETQENTEILYDAGAESLNSLNAAELAVRDLESTIDERTSAAELLADQMETSYTYFETMEKSLQEQIQTLTGATTGGSNMYSAQLAYQRGQAKIHSPVTGKVLFIDAKAGDLADVSKPIAAVYQEGFVGAEVYLSAADATMVYPGMDAQVIIKGREKEYRQATVNTVASYAKERISVLGLAESRVEVTLTLLDSDNLIMGQKVDVEFNLETIETALAVPKSAVFEYQEGFAVMTANDGKAQLRVIEKEFDTDTMTVIKSGLQSGDTVLLTPKQEGLREGTRISVRLLH